MSARLSYRTCNFVLHPFLLSLFFFRCISFSFFSFLLSFLPSDWSSFFLLFSSFSFAFFSSDIFTFQIAYDLAFVCNLQRSCYVLFYWNKQATVNSFILDNAPNKWQRHCWLKWKVHTWLLGVCRDSTVLSWEQRMKPLGWGEGQKTQWWLWNEEVGDCKDLRLSSSKGHFGLSVYIGVTSTTIGNCWDLGTLSSFESILSLIKQCKPGNPFWLQTMLWSQACIWVFSIKTLK